MKMLHRIHKQRNHRSCGLTQQGDRRALVGESPPASAFSEWNGLTLLLKLAFLCDPALNHAVDLWSMLTEIVVGAFNSRC